MGGRDRLYWVLAVVLAVNVGFAAYAASHPPDRVPLFYMIVHSPATGPDSPTPETVAARLREAGWVATVAIGESDSEVTAFRRGEPDLTFSFYRDAVQGWLSASAFLSCTPFILGDDCPQPVESYMRQRFLVAITDAGLPFDASQAEADDTSLGGGHVRYEVAQLAILSVSVAVGLSAVRVRADRGPQRDEGTR